MKSENDSTPRGLCLIEGVLVDDNGSPLILDGEINVETMNRIICCYNSCSTIPSDRLAKVILIGDWMWEASEYAQKAAMVADSKGFTRIGFLNRVIAWVKKGCDK